MGAVVHSDPLDTVNGGVWSTRDVVAGFAKAEGWSDPGERAAVLSLASAVRGQPMLDLGMGGGRTTTWALLLTDDYVGVDVTSAMVTAAQNRHPGVAFHVGDARDLSEFSDQHFGFVMFSFNGIDAVGHEDRRIVLGEIARVLRPGGQVLLSTDNRDSPTFTSTPWHRGKAVPDGEPGPPPAADPHATRDRLEHLTNRAFRLLADPLLPFRRAASWRALRRQSEDHDEWSIGPMDAYAFGLLVHWTTLAAACGELDAAGLEVTRVFRSDTGAQVDPADWRRRRAVTCGYVHLVAERRQAAY